MPNEISTRRGEVVAAVNFYGIDGCRGGWIVARLEPEQGISFLLAEELQSLFEGSERGSIVAIDIPIGLSEKLPRRCDVEARAFLGRGRGSSVFPAPCRSSLNAVSFRDACERNLAASGRMISCQCYGILPKIREIDALMSPYRQEYIREVHPEVAFAILAGHPMLYRKRAIDGVRERLAILASSGVSIDLDTIQEFRRKLGRGKVQVDDMIDAAALVLAAERIASGTARIFGDARVDSRNLRMEIVA